MMNTVEKVLPFKNRQKEPEKIVDADPVNILVVDDLPEKLMVYETILEELGQNVVTARTGKEALKLVLNQDFAVILLDVNMPGMDGFETATLIRQRRKSAHTPIIFLTAFTDEIRMAQGYASGAVDYLPTPVVPDILRAKVRVFIELSQMRRQAALQAEEHAMRKAAEESARRLEFLVNVNHIFARAQDQKSILQSLTQLSVSYLASESSLFMKDYKTGQLKLVGMNLDGEISTDMTRAAEILALLEKEIHQALEEGQPLTVSKFPVSMPRDRKKEGGKSYRTAVIVPLIIKGHIDMAFILLLNDHERHDPITTLSLANVLMSRIRIALENAILVEKIKEADRRKDEFLAMLAHELRNPLAPIRNGINILKTNPDEHLRTQVEYTIEHQIEHMVHLVDDLMDISRITKGKIDLRKQPIKLHDALSHAIEASEPLISKHGHKMIVTMPEPAIWVDGDFGRLSQVFSNLLNNAAKYTNNNGIIEVSLYRSSASAIVSIKDNGIGIPESMLQRIFDLFSQVDSSLERSQGGLGIGLTLARNLVEMHGGTINASSSGINTGSEFVVTLPALVMQEVPSEHRKVQKTSDTDRHLKILVVDDNEAAAEIMGIMLELMGHEIQRAHDGFSAIELAQRFQPEIVLLDIGLPGMNGYDTCKLMKEDPVLKDTLFIAQTGWGQPEHRKLSREAGFDHHLVKPVNMDELQRIMRRHSSKRPQIPSFSLTPDIKDIAVEQKGNH